MELFKTAWTSVLSIIVLFLLTKLMGNKQVNSFEKDTDRQTADPLR